eukprot:s4063_g7.t1
MAVNFNRAVAQNAVAVQNWYNQIPRVPRQGLHLGAPLGALDLLPCETYMRGGVFTDQERWQVQLPPLRGGAARQLQILSPRRGVVVVDLVFTREVPLRA